MTNEEYDKLTDEEIRIKVAEFCKWTDLHMSDCILFGTRHWSTGESAEGCDVPNYPHDLNACHEFEKMLEYKFEYDKCLAEIVMEDMGHEYTWHATASQKCKAFVLTMEDK